jgi:site-specific recombinase XerD
MPDDIDVYFGLAGQHWSRNSLRTCAKMLRAWFAHCEIRRWIPRKVSTAIILPRMYQHEGLPIGPTWDQVGQILAETAGDDPTSLRDHATILLLSVYGLRSGELRRLQLDDIDWSRHRIRVIRSKSRREEALPLEPRVGNAIARYLRLGRPKVDSRNIFVTLRAPHRPLSAGGLYNVVMHHLSKVASPGKGRGPHSLRHACARHLLESGCTLKEVGDHLGHRNPDATRHYAKVNLVSLRRVALEDLGGLS